MKKFLAIFGIGTAMIVGGTIPIIDIGDMQLIYSAQDYCGDSYVDTGAGTTTLTSTKEEKPLGGNCPAGEKYAYSVFQNSKGERVVIEISNEKYADIGNKDGALRNPTKEEYQSAFEAFTTKAEAAIARDNRQVTFLNNTGLSITFPATTTNSVVVVVGIYDNSNVAGGNITGCTYNGTAMVEDLETAVPGDAGGNASVSINHLIATTTAGTYNIVCTRTDAANDFYVQYASYTGADMTTQPDSTDSSTVSGSGTITNDLTSTVANTWAVTMARNTAGNFTDGTNFVQFTASSLAQADSNGAIATVGAVAVTGTFSSANAAMVSLLLRPATDVLVPVYPQLYISNDVVLEGDLLIN